MIGGGQPVSEAVALLEKSDAAMVLSTASRPAS